jgi:uncharacterized protein YecE (DUF72 family)
MKIKVGCCGFPVGMGRYYETFRLVEVQKTFYQLPRLSLAEKWRRQSPGGFEFTLKASQIITHPATSPTYRKGNIEVPEGDIHLYGFFRPTRQVLEAWERTTEIAAALGARVVVLQCPASFKPEQEHMENLRAFLKAVDRMGLLLAWEPRGAWPDETVEGICRECGLIHCVDPLEKAPVTRGRAYFRLHGGPGYHHRYTDEELQQLMDICQGYEEAYVLFNNLSMFDDARRFLDKTNP